MVKLILRNLAITFIASSVISTVALFINHHFNDVVDFDSGFNGLIQFAIDSYFILTILSLPALLIAKISIRKRNWLVLVVYFGGSIIPLIALTLPAIIGEGRYADDWLMTMIISIFVIIHFAFFIRLSKKPFI